MSDDQITFSERLVAGFLSAVLMAIMAVFVPIGLVVLSRGKGLIMLNVFSTFHAWGISLITVAAIIGATLGTNRSLIIFGHLWGTETPKSWGITLILWTILVLIALISSWLFGRHHAI